jgi:hypothetical protein
MNPLLKKKRKVINKIKEINNKNLLKHKKIEKSFQIKILNYHSKINLLIIKIRRNPPLHLLELIHQI